MTATAEPTRTRGAASPSRAGTQGAPTELERRLVLALCGTAERRCRESAPAAALLPRVDPRRLGALLERLRLTGLVGGRLQELGVPVDPRLEEEIESWTAQVRERARTHELTTLAILAELEQAGVRALALKGSVLARELYGDVGVRSPGDIDLLVAPEHLPAAVQVVHRMGWTHQAVASRATALPLLHETLGHTVLPRVELHWRVHWYETGFAADALARADRAAPHEPLIMDSADGLAALMLFYARDGFAGLRMPADAATWWDTRCEGYNLDALVEHMATRYPQLGAPLRLGAEILAALVGLPTSLETSRFRLRVAARLATPFEEVTLAQVKTKIGLVDLLLAPRRGACASVRRERQKIPPGLERPLTRHDPLSVRLARAEHVLRTLRRWTLALAPAAWRARRSRITAGAEVAQRTWT